LKNTKTHRLFERLFNTLVMIQTAQHLRQTLTEILPFLQQISDQEASIKPLPHKWSKKEILGHLIDSACNNQQKFVRMMAQPHLNFVGYAQDFWVSNQHYNQASWQELVSLWYAYNNHISHIIEYVNPNFLQNTITIEGNGCYTLEFIMQDYPEHLKHHLKAILPEIGLKSTFQNVYSA
jgi:DinB superfamily